MQHNSLNALEAAIGKSLDGVTPGANEYDEVVVKVGTDNSVFSSYIDDFVMACSVTTELGGGKVPVTSEEIDLYLRACVQARVQNLRGRSYCWKRHDSYAIPSFLAVLLAQVGFVSNPDLGVELVPELADEVIEMDPKTLRRVSMYMMSLENHGFEMMQGLPRHRSGSWEMMSMEVVEEVVRSTTNTHSPVYSVCAAFLGTTGLASLLGANAFRIKYLDTAQAKALTYDLVAPKSS